MRPAFIRSESGGGIRPSGDDPGSGHPEQQANERGGDGRTPGTEANALLIVDDNIDLAENLRDVFDGEGYRCTIAPDGERAIELLMSLRFDLVLTDLRMGERSGIDVIRAACARWPGTPVVMMTAYIRGDQVADAYRAGAREVIGKPFSMEVLLETVRGVL